MSYSAHPNNNTTAKPEVQQLINLSHEHLNSHTAKAEEYAMKALTQSRLLNDVAGTSEALSALGRCRLLKDEYTKALRYFEKALTFAESNGSKKIKAKTLADLSVAKWMVGDYSKSKDFANKGLLLMGADKDMAYFRALCWNMKGHAEEKFGDFVRALESYDKGEKAVRNTPYHFYAANLLGSMGELLMRLNRSAEAHEILLRALKMFRSQKHHTGEATTLVNLGLLERYFSHSDEAYHYFNQALGISELSGSRRLIAQSLYGMGKVRQDKGKLQEAEVLMQMGREVTQSETSPFEDAEASMVLGELYLKMNKTVKARQHFFQTLDYADRNSVIAELPKIHHNIGLTYHLEGDSRSSLMHRKLSRTLYREIRRS